MHRKRTLHTCTGISFLKTTCGRIPPVLSKYSLFCYGLSIPVSYYVIRNDQRTKDLRVGTELQSTHSKISLWYPSVFWKSYREWKSYLIW